MVRLGYLHFEVLSCCIVLRVSLNTIGQGVCVTALIVIISEGKGASRVKPENVKIIEDELWFVSEKPHSVCSNMVWHSFVWYDFLSQY